MDDSVDLVTAGRCSRSRVHVPIHRAVSIAPLNESYLVFAVSGRSNWRLKAAALFKYTNTCTNACWYRCCSCCAVPVAALHGGGMGADGHSRSHFLSPCRKSSHLAGSRWGDAAQADVRFEQQFLFT